MRKILLLTLAALLVASVAAATVVGTDHDLSTSGPGAQTNVNRVCVFCHTPHQAAAANGQDPLWNHTLSAVASYGVYASVTMNAAPTDIGGAVAGSASVSNLCMSCHDGTIAVHSLYNPPNEVVSVTITAGGNVDGSGIISGTPLVGTSLADDHPINFTYDTALATADGELNDPASTPAVAALLFGGSVQCASCHDPHEDVLQPFMVIDNAQSALCTTCHVK